MPLPSIFTQRIVVLLILIAVLLGAAIPISMAQDDDSQAEALALRITIVFDNTIYEGDLESAWGFAAIIERGDHTLLFDTGADGPMLLRNMEQLGFDPLAIDTLVLSHNHGDHTLGLDSVLATGVQPAVYLLPSFPSATKRHIAKETEVIEVERGQEVAPGIFTTGEMPGPPGEQSLAIPTPDGLIVLTGCAHPGIVAITTEAKSLFEDDDQPVILAMGGFHLMQHSDSQLDAIIDSLRDLGVQRVMPTHCTGEGAIAHFADVLGEDYVEGGVGRAIEFEIAVDESEPDAVDGA